MTEFFQIEACKGTPACTVIPKKEMHLDLEKYKKKFDTVHLSTPLILVVECKGCEASIHPSGKLLIKSENSELVKKIANEIYERIASS